MVTGSTLAELRERFPRVAVVHDWLTIPGGSAMSRPEARAEMMTRSGRRSVPQIFIGATHVGGCDDLHELEASGRLDTLLKTGV